MLDILWSLVLFLLLVSGAVVAFRRTDSSFPLLSLIVVFVGLALYVRFFTVDPWTGTEGHTWQLFKSAKWAYLGIAALQVAGLLQITKLKRFGSRIALCSLTGAFVLVPALSASCENYASERRQLETVTGSSRPASAFRELRSKFSQMQFQSLYMIRSVAPPNPWPDLFYAYLLSPFQLASDWSGTYYFDDLAPFSTKGGAKPLGTALMVTTSTVALRDKANLSMAGLAVINPLQPALVSIRHPNGIEQEGTFVWLDNRPAEIIISPAGAARLALGFDLAPGPNLPDPKRCTLRLNLGGETRDLAVTIPSPVWLDLNLHRQTVDKVTVSALDRGIVSTSTRDSRTLLVSLRNTRLLAHDSWRLFNPNGIDLERSDALTFWLGPPASLLAFSTRGGWADVRFEASPGPSLPERPDRTIRIRLGSQTVAENHLTKPTTLQFRCPLSAGINQLQLEVVEKPSISQLPNGDSRTLMVRVTDFSVQLQTNP